MPVKRLGLTFTPESFFALNPSMDVPEVNDSHSAPAFPNGIRDHDGADNCCPH
jgi:primary-amine oxidase